MGQMLLVACVCRVGIVNCKVKQSIFALSCQSKSIDVNVVRVHNVNVIMVQINDPAMRMVDL